MWLLRWSRLVCVFSRIFSAFSSLFQVSTMAVVRASGGARRRGERGAMRFVYVSCMRRAVCTWRVCGELCVCGELRVCGYVASCIILMSC